MHGTPTAGSAPTTARSPLLRVFLTVEAPTPASHSTRQIIDLGTLGGYASAATAINRHSQVVGYSEFRPGDPCAHAFLWEDGRLRDLGTLGGEESLAQDIDDHGRVVGSSRTATRDCHAFLWEDGALRDLGTLGGSQSEALAINNRGQIVGRSTTADGAIHAFLWEDGQLHDLGADLDAAVPGGDHRASDVNEGGQVVGALHVAGGDGAAAPGLALHWRAATGEPAGRLGTLGGPESVACGIDAGGRIVGASCTRTGATHAFVWDGGVMHDLGALPGGRSLAAAINDRGQIVGVSTTLDPYVNTHAVLWQGGQLIDLGTLVGSGGTSHAKDINDQGVIVGWSSSAAAAHAVLWR